MWEPATPSPPEPGWWTQLPTAEQIATDRWVEGIASDLRAERVERLKARAHAVDMKAAGALMADRQRRINGRHVQINGWDERLESLPGASRGYQRSWGAGGVEHSGVLGRVLSVR
jgi:hypothetical protein